MVDPIGSYAGISIQGPSGVGSIQGPATAKVNESGRSNFGPAYQVQLSAAAQAASTAPTVGADFASNITNHADAILSALDGDYGRMLHTEWQKVQ